MEPDTLTKQTCYRESVYILLFPFLSLPFSLPLFSLHCLGWQLLDCYTSRSPWRWLLRGKTQTHNLFLLTAIHCMFVSGCPCGQYSLDARLKCESRGEDTTGQDKAWISTCNTQKSPKKSPQFLRKHNPVEDKQLEYKQLESKDNLSHCGKSKRCWHTDKKWYFKS